MDRRAFLKLAAASPALVSPVYAGSSDGNPDGEASRTVIGAPSHASQAGFTFYSPLAEGWYRSGDYFEWTSTTRNNKGRRVRVFYRTFGSRSNPALVILQGGGNASFEFRELIPFLEEDYFVAVLDFPGCGFSDKPQDGYSYMLEDDAKLVDHFVREIVGLSRFHLLTHSRGGSVGLAFLGDYLAREEKEYEITYHFITASGLFLPLANLPQNLIDILPGISVLPAPDGTFIHPRDAQRTKFYSAHNRPVPEAVTSAHADVEPTGAAAFKAFLRHRSTLVPFFASLSLHSAARQPAGTGSVQILRSISPKSRRFR